jgi:putative transferase (TIGR04331 family)
MSQRNLYLSEVPDDFDKNKDLVIHFGCFSGKEDQFPFFLDFAHSEPTQQQLIAEDANIAISTKYFCGVLGEYLEHSWGHQKHSQKFWITVLYPYVSYVLQMCWEAERIVDELKNKYYSEVLVVYLFDNNFIFQDTQDFVLKSRKLPFNACLFSKILSKKAPESWLLKQKKHASSNVPILKQQEQPKFNLEKFCYSILEKYGRYHPIYGLSPLESVLMSFLLWLKPTKLRAIQADEPIENRFNSCLDILDLLKMWLPESLRLATQHQVKGIKAGKLNLGSRDLFFNDYYKIKIAHALEQGERLVGVQHGGHTYGSSSVSRYLGDVEYSHDAFLTWGFQHQQGTNGNLIPLPSPMLSKIANLHREQNKNMILLGTNILYFKYLFYDFRDPQCYRQNKEIFISSLNKDLRTHLLYRPYFNDHDSLPDKKYYAKTYPWLKFHEGNFHKDLLTCRLLILDHLGTTLNMALAANTPTICFWGDKMVHLTADAERLLNGLKEVGIIFNDPHDAVTKIQEVFHDVQAWWEDPKVQKARLSWCQVFAKTSPTWRREWLKAIWRI